MTKKANKPERSTKSVYMQKSMRAMKRVALGHRAPDRKGMVMQEIKGNAVLKVKRTHWNTYGKEMSAPLSSTTKVFELRKMAEAGLGKLTLHKPKTIWHQPGVKV
jgi:hypothetical protein